MTREQVAMLRILSRCRMWKRRHREKVREWRLMYQCDPALDIGAWDDHKMREFLHYYRRQHGQCRCSECLSVMFETMTRDVQAGQMSLFFEGGSE